MHNPEMKKEERGERNIENNRRSKTRVDRQKKYEGVKSKTNKAKVIVMYISFTIFRGFRDNCFEFLKLDK